MSKNYEQKRMTRLVHRLPTIQSLREAPARRGLFSLGLFLFGSGLVAQQPAVAPAKNCTIEGLVVKAQTGEPLKRAWVGLRKVEGRPSPASTITDASGRFLLKDIEPGQYRLWAERSGYVPQEYGERGRNPVGTTLTLESGQHLRDIVFRLLPTSAISGRIYGEDNEHVAGVRVQALRKSYVRDQQQLVLAGAAVTNDLGEYRLYGLSPGRYYISASYTPRPTAFGLAGIREAGAEGGYAPTYYPGTNSPGRAAAIELRAGEDVRGIDLALLLGRTIGIRGQVFDALSGRPGRGATLSLVPAESGVGGVLFRNQTIVEDARGSFEIRAVAPGSYILSANWFDGGKSYATRQILDVGTSDLDGVNLALAPGVDVPGRIRLEGGTQLKFAGLRVLLQPRNGSITDGAGALVQSDGTFVLMNVVDEDYDLFVVGAPENFYLKVARLDGNDVLDSGFSLRRSHAAGTLELALSPAGGHIEGIVLNKQREAFGGALVVLIPEPSQRGQVRLYKMTTTDQYGRFSLPGIPPGDYRLFAWEEIEPGAYQDADFLPPYEKRGETVPVVEASRYSVELKLIRANERPQ